MRWYMVILYAKKNEIVSRIVFIPHHYMSSPLTASMYGEHHHLPKIREMMKDGNDPTPWHTYAYTINSQE
jgi:hypothetical protein